MSNFEVSVSIQTVYLNIPIFTSEPYFIIKSALKNNLQQGTTSTFFGDVQIQALLENHNKLKITMLG